MPTNMESLRKRLQDFEFKKLFVEEMGWSNPARKRALTFDVRGEPFKQRGIAELSGVAVFEIESSDGHIPDAKIRAAVHKAVAKHHHENVLIFVDKARSQSLWFWGKREGGKILPREHPYFKGQPGDLFISKLAQMCFDLSEFDEDGRIPIVEVARRIHEALNVEPVTKKFYREFQDQHIAFLELIAGVDNDQQRRWYASVLLNRLMFIYFLEKKGFVDNGNLTYLRQKLDASKANGKDQYFIGFLKPLFFEGFAKPERDRSPEVRALLGDIRYLNGGLFLPHTVEQRYPKLAVSDRAFENLFDLFERYSWNLDDTPGGQDDEINPDVLGYIFEKYINQKAFGAYYTRPEITEYLCERTIHQLILDAIEKIHPGRFTEIGELLMGLDAALCKRLLLDVLPKLSLLDPACGSGAFLVAAMKVLIDIYSAVFGRIPFIKSPELKLEIEKIQRNHKSINYYIKKRIITDNLFGVDIMEEATEIARLRLFLALVSAAESVDQLEPLPNIDFNVLSGNSLIGLLHVDPAQFEAKNAIAVRQDTMAIEPPPGKDDLPGVVIETKSGPTRKELEAEYLRDIRSRKFSQILEVKNRLIDTYRHAATYGEDLTALRDRINAHNAEAGAVLDRLLLDEFQALGIKFEQATWDGAKKKVGKPDKRAMTLEDIRALSPFHWGFGFDEVLNKRGGFDAIITNPPWEIFKPNAKEFFQQFSDLITKKKMLIGDFKKHQKELLKDPEIREAWLTYLSDYPHQSAYFRSAEVYQNQISIVNGKKVGTDINLYKLFTERCHNLLRPGGRCGIILPSGIYTDLGAKQLREMLFSSSETDSIVGLSNERFIFESVHHAFKFCLLVFEKGGSTEAFSAVFRINPGEAVSPDRLGAFLHERDLRLFTPIDLVRRLSPDSLSVMEFKSETDIHIADKMLRFPLLGERLAESWNVRLAAEFHMTNASHLFKTARGPDCIPLYEGKMIHQFTHTWDQDVRYWIEEDKGRLAILGRTHEEYQGILDYQTYRPGFRKIASSTNERTLVATILPPMCFASENFQTLLRSHPGTNSPPNNIESLYVVAVLNSFTIDSAIRHRVTANVNFFYVYQLPIPRLTESDPAFLPIVERAARLICTTPEFDELAKEVGLDSHKVGATHPAERAQLRAELDGLVAHLYDLTEDEFSHILTTFPLVDQGVKDAALDAYRAFAPKTEDEEAAALVRAGESGSVEFKSTVRWDLRQGKPNKALERTVVEETAAFLNSEGGTLLIGVADDGTALGLEDDFKVFTKRKDADAYENWLMQLLLNEFGKNCAPLLRITFPKVSGVQICRLDVSRAPKPTYVKTANEEHLYIRAGNSKKRLSTRETVEYVKRRWD